MKLSRKSLIVRWAYWIDGEPPKRTNVCTLFWRAFVGIPILTIFAGLMLAVAGPIYLISLLVKKGLPATRLNQSGNVFWQRVIDWKNKTCTMVELE